MYRRPLADVQKAFSRLFQQNVHRYTHGLSELSGRCTDTTNNDVCVWMSLLQEGLAACALSRLGMP